MMKTVHSPQSIVHSKPDYLTVDRRPSTVDFQRWLILIGIVTGLCFAKVTQQTAIWLAAYELGRQVLKLHELENDTLWLRTQVVALRSPAHLAKAMRPERRHLVAWTELQSELRLAQVAKALTTPSQDFRSE